MKNLDKNYNSHLRYKIINDRMARQMVNSRKCVLFEEFDKKLLELYPARKEGQMIPELYPAIPDWAENVSKPKDNHGSLIHRASKGRKGREL